MVFAFYSVFLKRLPNDFSIVGFLFVNIALGWIGIVPFYLYDVAAGSNQWPITQTTISVLAYVAVFPSIVSGVLWLYGIRMGGPALAGICYNFIPVFASILAVVFLGEEFHPAFILPASYWCWRALNVERLVRLFSRNGSSVAMLVAFIFRS